MAVHLDAPGSTDAAVGEQVVIHLHETPTTGYQWVVVEPHDGLDVDGSTFEPPTSAAPGAGGRRVVTVHATQAGTHRLRLEQRRSWEAAATDTCEVVVTAS
jgi:predicted secreted protein